MTYFGFNLSIDSNRLGSNDMRTPNVDVIIILTKRTRFK